ncbi:HAD family hydrolase [Kitasatospora cheerisanensis]|uniref:HAD family hydrolase n=1 Tax=Kitasatospora cheerisanensis TaxID=81942 RepID=UPI00068DFA47|nr:HAD-IB family hydrolase [Kitasatospora cheerisanensis]
MSVAARLVFSDVDETLIDCKSMFDFLDFHLGRRYGPAGLRRARAVRADLAAAVASGVPRERANRTYYRAWVGEPAAAVGESGRAWFAERAREDGFWIASVREALAAHRAAGDRIVLVSGSFAAIVKPLARHVGAAVLCSRPEVRGGVFTGGLAGAPVIGEEKRRLVRGVLRALPHVDPARCYAYGDHVSDLPMLAEVGHPVLVGAPQLAARLPGARLLPGAPAPAERPVLSRMFVSASGAWL